LGFTNYHRAFIEEYTQMEFPLQALTGKRTYQWGNEQERAFEELRNAMVRAPVLALPNATDPFILDTDASDKSVCFNTLESPHRAIWAHACPKKSSTM
jgi:hypothetical protein